MLNDIYNDRSVGGGSLVDFVWFREAFGFVKAFEIVWFHKLDKLFREMFFS